MTADELSQWRRRRGYSQEAIAERAGIDQSYYYLMESGGRPVTEAVEDTVREIEAERQSRLPDVERAVNEVLGTPLEIAEIILHRAKRRVDTLRQEQQEKR